MITTANNMCSESANSAKAAALSESVAALCEKHGGAPW